MWWDSRWCRYLTFVRMGRKTASVRTTKRTLPQDELKLVEKVEPEYYFEGGLRKVKPYYFEYQTYAKERWLGRSILDVFLKEFRDRPARYYQEAINRGLITINGQPCELERLLEPSDLIGHKLHRHEPPVTAQPIKILHQDDGILVIEKPASIPVHPSGRYRFNTVVEILRAQLGLDHLSIINRLDRLTSGICILGTSPSTAEKLHQQMEGGEFHKEYVARVVGTFPEKAECNEPLKIIEHKLGLVSVDAAGGKASRTLFERVATNGKESIVLCRPLTGRTHQIRVHLRFLGHPIVNDHLYNNSVWPKDQIQLDTAQLKQIARVLLDETIEREGLALESALAKATEHEGPNDKGQASGIICPDCEMNRLDPTPEQLCIYLHAFRYSCPAWSFETSMPIWSQLDDCSPQVKDGDANAPNAQLEISPRDTNSAQSQG